MLRALTRVFSCIKKTDLAPVDDAGTVKVAVITPLLSGITGDGSVGTGLSPLKPMVTGSPVEN